MVHKETQLYLQEYFLLHFYKIYRYLFYVLFIKLQIFCIMIIIHSNFKSIVFNRLNYGNIYLKESWIKKIQDESQNMLNTILYFHINMKLFKF